MNKYENSFSKSLKLNVYVYLTLILKASISVDLFGTLAYQMKVGVTGT